MQPKLAEKTSLQRVKDFAVEFFLKPASAKPLAVLRIGLASVLLLQALSLVGSFYELYGPDGVVQRSVMIPDELADEPFLGPPSVRWVMDALSMVNIQVSDTQCTAALFLIYVSALCGLLLGWRTRLSAFVAWGTHYLLNGTADASIYGVDAFAHIFLFYCVWMPTGHMLSLDQKAGRVSGEPSSLARASVRMLQLHLCVIYFATGIHKAMGPDWWDGESIWRALNLREMVLFDFSWLAYVPAIAVALCWATLAVEIGYAFLVWPNKTRKWMALATVGLHAGIGLTMGLLSFSALMSVLTISAFLFSAEPQPAVALQPAKTRRGRKKVALAT